MLTSDNLYNILLNWPHDVMQRAVSLKGLNKSMSALEKALVRVFDPKERSSREGLNLFMNFDHYLPSAREIKLLSNKGFSQYIDIFETLFTTYPELNTKQLCASMHPDTLSELSLKYFNTCNYAGLIKLPASKLLVSCGRIIDNINDSETVTKKSSGIAKIACVLCTFTPEILMDDPLHRYTVMDLAKKIGPLIIDNWKDFTESEKIIILAFESTIYDFAVHELENPSYFPSTSRNAIQFLYLPHGWDMQKITKNNKLLYLEEVYGDKFSPSFFQQLKVQNILIEQNISLPMLKEFVKSLNINAANSGAILPEFNY